MITENLSTLKIHKLTQAQYDRELAAGNIDENALYLTPDEGTTLEDLGVTATVKELNYLHDLAGDRVLTTNPSGYVYASEIDPSAASSAYIRIGHYGSSWNLTTSYQNVAGNYLDGEIDGSNYKYDSTNKNIIIQKTGIYLIMFKANAYASNNSGSGVVSCQITWNGEGSYDAMSYLYNGYTSVSVFGTLTLTKGDVINAQLKANTQSGTIKTDGNENLWVIRLQ